MKELSKLIQAHFEKMCKTGKLFRANITGDQVWNLYISSFKEDPIFRDPASTSHTCNHCKNFIRRYGNIVSLNDKFQIVSIFDIEGIDEYKPVMKALSKKIKTLQIGEVFFETFEELNKLPYESCTKKSTIFQLGVSSNPKRYTTKKPPIEGY